MAMGTWAGKRLCDGRQRFFFFCPLDPFLERLGLVLQTPLELSLPKSSVFSLTDGIFVKRHGVDHWGRFLGLGQPR